MRNQRSQTIEINTKLHPLFYSCFIYFTPFLRAASSAFDFARAELKSEKKEERKEREEERSLGRREPSECVSNICLTCSQGAGA